MKKSQARSILCSYGNQVQTSLSSCFHTCWRSERKGKTEKDVKVWQIFLLCNGSITKSLRNGVLVVLALVAYLRGWHTNVGVVGGMLVWVVC